MKSAQHVLSLWITIATILSIVSFSSCDKQRAVRNAVRESTDAASVPDFSREVQAVLEQRIRRIEELAAEPVVVRAVQDANRDNKLLSDSEIADLDQRWQANQRMDDLAKSLFSNQCAQFLLDFQDEHDGFPEIFVTDAKGLVVAATNRTSDYLQSDEPWWQSVYNDGRDSSRHGEIEYDESAHSESISLYAPVLDPDSADVIGVVKAVCDITAIKMEL